MFPFQWLVDRELKQKQLIEYKKKKMCVHRCGMQLNEQRSSKC